MLIMVLDSNESDRKKAVQYIREIMPQAEVLDFSDGRDALSAALRRTPYLLITEVFSNGMDGIFMAKALRDRKIKVNIIFTTNYKNNLRYAINFFHMQASYCIDKPLSVSSLKDAIGKVRFPIAAYRKELNKEIVINK